MECSRFLGDGNADRPVRESRMPITAGHPNDISDAALRSALLVVERPDLLLRLVTISRRYFGFFSRHPPYAIVYPWVADLLMRLPNGARLLDMGAGINPLPLLLAEAGMFVNCVDHSETHYQWPLAVDVSEWGYLDYHDLNKNLTSFNCGIANHSPCIAYDAIYSVGMLMAMPGDARRAAFRRCAEWLRPGGELVVMLGLFCGTDELWNRSQGAEVEPRAMHGTVQDVLDEIEACNLSVERTRFVRDLPDAPTNSLCLQCRRPANPDN